MAISLVTRGYDAAKQQVQKFESDDPYTKGAVRLAVGGVLIAEGLFGLENPMGKVRTVNGRRQRVRNRRPGVLGSIGGVLGSILFIIGAIFWYGTPETDATVQGEVVNFSQTQRVDDDGNVRTECRFVVRAVIDNQDRSITDAGKTGSRCNYFEGAPITVHYDSADPTTAFYGDPIGTRDKLIAVGIGILLLIASLFRLAMRVFALFFGWKLVRSGRTLMKENPKREGSDKAAEDAKKAVTSQIFEGGLGIGNLGNLVRGGSS